MNQSSFLLCLTILSTSFWGSWHCAAMCGPVASLMGQKKQLLSYHLGRGLSYIAIGTLGGYLGGFFLQSQFIYLRYLSGLLFALILLWMGYRIFQQKNISGGLFIFQKLFKGKGSGLSLGLLSVFLPCGWLYTYIMAAIASQSPFSGALVMFLFWLGGLPAMSALSLFMKKSIQLSHFKKQRIAGLVLVGAGLYSLASFYFMH